MGRISVGLCIPNGILHFYVCFWTRQVICHSKDLWTKKQKGPRSKSEMSANNRSRRQGDDPQNPTFTKNGTDFFFLSSSFFGTFEMVPLGLAYARLLLLCFLLMACFCSRFRCSCLRCMRVSSPRSSGLVFGRLLCFYSSQAWRGRTEGGQMNFKNLLEALSKVS